MIGHLKGIILTTNDRFLLLSVHDVGYKIFAPLPLLLSSKEGDTYEVFVHTHVREDVFVLYGFEKETELELFEKLISVSGIGPKSALAMLSVHSPSSVADAIERADVEALSHTPGIGKKTAEKCIIELKGKLTHLQSEGGDDATFEVRLALEALGYSPKQIHEVIGKLNTKGKDRGALIKEALTMLK